MFLCVCVSVELTYFLMEALSATLRNQEHKMYPTFLHAKNLQCIISKVKHSRQVTTHEMKSQFRFQTGFSLITSISE